MWWIIGPICGIAGLLLLATLIGVFLPKNHIASRTAILPVTPEALWTVITDVEAYPSWRSELSKVEVLKNEANAKEWRETSRFGEIPFAVTEYQPHARLVTKINSDDLAFGGVWTYELAPEGAGTRLTITENGVINNPFYRFMARFIFGYSASIDGYLGSLGKKHGKEITIEDGASLK